jgi:hypothetical protein
MCTCMQYAALTISENYVTLILETDVMILFICEKSQIQLTQHILSQFIHIIKGFLTYLSSILLTYSMVQDIH